MLCIAITGDDAIKIDSRIGFHIVIGAESGATRTLIPAQGGQQSGEGGQQVMAG
jgi:hypothetical protein